ncbi:MAG: type IV secretory system conjugative DNA transfer family protein, partial [Actinomycetes bacterium]
MTARAAAPDNGARDVAVVAVIVATLIVAVVLLVAAHATSLILHGHPAHLSASTLGRLVPGHAVDVGDWGAESGVSSAVLFWTIAAVLALGCAVGARKWWVWWQPRRERERFRTLPGMGSRARVLRETGRTATMRSGKYTRPGTVITKPEDAGYAVGNLGGHRLYASVEDAGTVFGPPRCGKGVSIVIPLILDAPGSVVATATRPETVAVTMLHRQRAHPDGPIAIFDPQGLTGLAPGLRWSITRGCQSPHTALVRGAALAAGSNAGKGTTDESHWRDITADLASALLQAAAIKGKGANDLYRWSISPNNAKEAVRILTEYQGAQSEWGVYLKSFLDGDPRIRDSAFSGLRQAFRPLSNPAVRALVTPKSEAETLDPASFMRNKGTLYLLGTASGSGPASSLISALISDFAETGRTVATRMPGGRLNPPHLNVLDEIVQLCRLPDLGGLMADGGGSGITTFVVAQSPSQIETIWSASEKN